MMEVLINYLIENILEGNADKCHLIIGSKTPVETEVSNITIMSEGKVTLFRIYNRQQTKLCLSY